MDTERLKEQNAVPNEKTDKGVSIIIEDIEETVTKKRQNTKGADSLKNFLSSPFMLVLAILVSANALFVMLAGYGWIIAIPFSASLLFSAVALWLTYFDASSKAAYEPRGLLLVSLSVSVQKVLFFTFSVFFLIYVFFAFIKKDILLGMMGNLFETLSSFGLWNIPIFLCVAFIIYCGHRFLWHKSMFVDNFRDASELGLMFDKGVAEYAGTCVCLALVRIALFIIKPSYFAKSEFLPSGFASFLGTYGIWGRGGALETTAVILNVILLIYLAALALIYIINIKNFKKTKKTLDKRRKL